jgi:hypothetical protein
VSRCEHRWTPLAQFRMERFACLKCRAIKDELDNDDNSPAPVLSFCNTE